MKRIKVYGPPGTGKTTFLVNTVKNYINSGKLTRDVAFVTFTRTAQAEAINRLKPIECPLSDETLEHGWPYVRTLHSLCYRALKMSQSRMVQPRDLCKFGELVGCEITGEPVDGDDTVIEEMPLGDKLLRLNHVGRHRKLSLSQALEHMPIDVDMKLAKHFTISYKEWKLHEAFVDFTDILSLYLSAAQPSPCTMFIVDEAQDLSPLQWDVVDKMSSRADYLIAAGDDDQAIYTWAGATADEFNDWKADETLILDQSFRLPSSVWSACVKLTNKIQKRVPKAFKPRDFAGEIDFEIELPDLAPLKDTLVLYRFSHRGKQLAKLLKAQGIPFGGALSTLSRPIVRKALEALNLPVERRSKEMKDALISLGAKVDAKTPISLYKLWDCDYLQQIFTDFGLAAMLNPPITLSSIHQAKGREADLVVLDLTMSRASYEHLLDFPDDENRVWYVGASRAKEKLTFLEGMGEYQYEL